jgi:hypothetical protein
MDDLGRWLDNEWKVGRATRAYDEMFATFRKLNDERTPERVENLLAHAQADPALSAFLSTAGEAAVLTYRAQATAENLLMAVAIYLANDEGDGDFAGVVEERSYASNADRS